MLLSEDLRYLKRFTNVVLLEAASGARVVVAPDYQARVMTSSPHRDGPSLGWINRAFLGANTSGTAYDNYGGEERLWFGPQGGPSGFFQPAAGDARSPAWQVPDGLQAAGWSVSGHGASFVTLECLLTLTNRQRNRFAMRVEREIRLLSASKLEGLLGTALPAELGWVAYESNNRITNIGDSAWDPGSQSLHPWLLGTFPASREACAFLISQRPAGVSPVAPQAAGAELVSEAETGGTADVDSLPRLRCDGERAARIQLACDKALGWAASYAPHQRRLTLLGIRWEAPVPAGPRGSSPPAPCDAGWLAASNGGRDPGEGLCPAGVYELEASAPLLALAPGETTEARRTAVHLVGDARGLSAAAGPSLGFDLQRLSCS